jgi:ferredoxin--NADP+ reductase
MIHAGHFVAIFGGAVSGAEAAYQLAKRGIHSAVFDQHALPYGKIEDGLPKWHIKLRDREEERIDEKLSYPRVNFVPNIRLGRDISFREVAEDWGFSAVLLAIGAGRDRPFPVIGIDEYIDKGFCYQNPFVYWFNHKHEPNYKGPVFEVKDDAIVIGGGLASLDVIKILMIETVQKALADRGIKADLFTLDRSIARVLEQHKLTLEDLGLKGARLFYRRRIKDMPLSPFPPNSPDKAAKAELVREKILRNYQKKYLFRMEENQMPIDKIVEDGRLKGLVFQQTEVVNGKLRGIPGTERQVYSDLSISSIGSLPEPVEGIPLAGQVFKISDPDSCQVEGYDHVFALGNAVTGRGNINESMRHGREVTQALVQDYFRTREKIYEETFRTAESGVKEKIEGIADRVMGKPRIPSERMTLLLQRVQSLQERSGYDGNYAKWIKTHRPVRLEEQIGYGH